MRKLLTLGGALRAMCPNSTRIRYMLLVDATQPIVRGVFLLPLHGHIDLEFCAANSATLLHSLPPCVRCCAPWAWSYGAPSALGLFSYLKYVCHITLIVMTMLGLGLRTCCIGCCGCPPQSVGFFRLVCLRLPQCML